MNKPSTLDRDRIVVPAEWDSRQDRGNVRRLDSKAWGELEEWGYDASGSWPSGTLKFHSPIHYSSSIILFVTTDNYNTEQTERPHIELTKDAYRATNHKDEIPQMTSWLSRHEKVQQHAAFIKWLQGHGQHATLHPTPIGPPQPSIRNLKI